MCMKKKTNKSAGHTRVGYAVMASPSWPFHPVGFGGAYSVFRTLSDAKDFAAKCSGNPKIKRVTLSIPA